MPIVDFKYGFKLPKGGISKVVMLVVMMVTSFLIIPLIWWLGYLADVLSSAIKKELKLPNFKFLRQMKLGLVVLGLEIAYLFIPFLVMEFNAWVGWVLLLLAAFILPIAICNYLVKNGAFNFSKHFNLVGKNPGGFLSIFGLLILFEVLFALGYGYLNPTGATGIVTVILGLLITLFIISYLAVVFARLYGVAYREAK